MSAIVRSRTAAGSFLLLGLSRRLDARLAAPSVLKTLEQPEHLPALQPEQLRRVVDPQPADLDVHQDAQPRKLLLAHRHHHARQLQSKRTRASSQLCGGVSFVYCCYIISIMEPVGRFLELLQ